LEVPELVMIDALIPLSSTERQQQLIYLLERQQRISVVQICEEFSVSEATARRDLDVLEEQGLIQRVHGGAIPVRRAEPELPILQRGQEQASEKQRIGRAAARLVSDGETIFLGSGTTVLEVARNLRQRRNLTVITNSLPVLNILADLPEATVVSLGGMLRRSELSFIGHITELSLAEVRVDKVIIGIHALSLEHGLTNEYLPETLTDRAILRIGQEVIVVADHTKCDCVSAAFVAPITSMHKLVTDAQTNQEWIREVEAKGVEVIVA
jgi:DeoR/GlpR family transcriptional regulator of sugar metabolism